MLVSWLCGGLNLHKSRCQRSSTVPDSELSLRPVQPTGQVRHKVVHQQRIDHGILCISYLLAYARSCTDEILPMN